MTERPLNGCRILVAEDEFLLAAELCYTLRDIGATIAGPVASVDEAIALMDAGEAIHGAILDINLCGQKVFPVADALQSRGVPFLFTSGYQRAAIPSRYAHVILSEKPFDSVDVARMIARQIRPHAGAAPHLS